MTTDSYKGKASSNAPSGPPKREDRKVIATMIGAATATFVMFSDSLNPLKATLTKLRRQLRAQAAPCLDSRASAP
jgi:hypothetical protein